MKIVLIIIVFLCAIAVIGLCWMSIKMLNQAQKGTLPSEQENDKKSHSAE